jgi:hypothetical protein
MHRIFLALAFAIAGTSVHAAEVKSSRPAP